MRAKTTPPRGRKASLKEYQRKRDFTRSPEPEPLARSAAGDHEFVVQKHAARRLHYDLRLELDGVLKSWAVTRGPTLTVGEKRLAVRTEDHPKEYLEFEGNIPKGEYGGGTMIVWDRGRWLPESDPRRGLEKGHLAFTLEGSRLKGRWHLVRMRRRTGEKAEPWLLIKSDDAFARRPGEPEIIEQEITSARSGRTTEELAAEERLRDDHAARANVVRTRQLPLPNIGRMRAARKGLLPALLEPTLAAPCERPPRGPKWIHEIKYDGYRIQARVDGHKVRLLTRKNLDWTQRFLSIAVALEKLELGSALLDGEIVVEDANGISNFNNLQADLKAGRQDQFRYYAFDILYYDGYDLTRATLLNRKRLLQTILATAPPGLPICFSEHLEQDGRTMLTHACRFGLEGIISKRKDLPYRPGRDDCWLKCKCVHRQEFVILGYVASTVASGLVGSLPLGYYQGDTLAYAGRVGTGWSVDQAKSLRQDLEKIPAERPRFAKPLPVGAETGVRWTEPRLVCEVEYHSWTADGLLRAAAFKGLRDDKLAHEIVLEEKPKRLKFQPADTIRSIRLTHPERILWEGSGVTKQGLAEFYADIADSILPHIVGRVLSLVRCPSGRSEDAFFAKHPWQGLSEAVRRVDVGKAQPMLVVDDLPGLLSLVQADVVEIHAWGSKSENIDHPDRLIFDLDPGEEIPWRAVVEAALEVRHRLESTGLKSFVKTSGGKGLHVVVPVEPRADWDRAKAFTAAIAKAMTEARPDRYVATATKRARRGRIFVDYLRNGRGATAVAPYSTRALPQASVSTPLEWQELSDDIRSGHFTVDNLRQRIEFLKRDPWEGFFTLRQRW